MERIQDVDNTLQRSKDMILFCFIVLSWEAGFNLSEKEVLEWMSIFVC